MTTAEQEHKVPKLSKIVILVFSNLPHRGLQVSRYFSLFVYHMFRNGTCAFFSHIGLLFCWIYHHVESIIQNMHISQYFPRYPRTSFCIGMCVIIHFSDLSDSPPPSPSHPFPLSCSLQSSELEQQGCCQPSVWSRPCDRGCRCC